MFLSQVTQGIFKTYLAMKKYYAWYDIHVTYYLDSHIVTFIIIDVILYELIFLMFCIIQTTNSTFVGKLMRCIVNRYSIT